MLTGILAGITWAIATVVLGIALNMSPFISSKQAMFLAPFVGTFLHDTLSALFLLIYNIIKGNLRDLFRVFKTTNSKWLITASAIGGPVGMTGYVMAVHYMGTSAGAVASAIYPAIGTLLACIFLKETVKRHQWIFLIFALLGVYGLSNSPNLYLDNIGLGLLGVGMCAFGWGVEAVILAKCFKDSTLKSTYVLSVRQTTSALIYGIILLPFLDRSTFTIQLLTSNTGLLIPTISVAALCATISYLLYYKTIAKIGASKAMALNITYTAWSVAFTVLLLGDISVLNFQTLLCSGIVVVCGILAATDINILFHKKRKR